MNTPDLDLNNGNYQILASKVSEGVHLQELYHESEIYINNEHFEEIAELMGYVKQE